VYGAKAGVGIMSAVIKDREATLRPMTAADIPSVMRVERAAYEFPWTENIFRDCLQVGYYCCVLEDDSGIIGHGVMSAAVGECHLLNICIHPDHQRHGHGERLVDYLLNIAYHAKARIAYLEVRMSNIAAKSLYLKRGFREVGVRKNYYPDPGFGNREDALILVLEMDRDNQDEKNISEPRTL
jgi:ribosomal-protein-alanine N-acetyltransferase